MTIKEGAVNSCPTCLALKLDIGGRATMNVLRTTSASAQRKRGTLFSGRSRYSDTARLAAREHQSWV